MGLNLNNIKNRLERLTCSTHLKHPVISILGSELKFNCCCETFKTKCVAEGQKAFAEEGKRAITETLNKSFKRFK